MVLEGITLQWTMPLAEFVYRKADNLKYCVIKHRPRGGVDENGRLRIEPDVIALQDRPVGKTVGHEIPWQEWWPFTLQLNRHDSRSQKYVTTPEASLWNDNQSGATDIDTTKPFSALSQSFGGNLKAVDYETDNHLHIVSWNYKTDLDKHDPTIENFATAPDKIMYASAINEAGQVFKVAGGLDVYIQQLSYTDLWIRREDVIMLPQKPASWTIANVLDPRWV